METFNMLLSGVCICNSYRSMKINGYDTNALDGIGNGFLRPNFQCTQIEGFVIFMFSANYIIIAKFSLV